jgi:ubiquitin carboxyl-terminal hydrolase 34
VDIASRTIIGETPNVLFVHLQRIVFSFETFTNEKVNSKFDFPTTLDLKPYSYKDVAERENLGESTDEELKRLRELEDETFIYKLVGVTIHVGAADHGHYYAIINSSRGEKEVDPVEKPQEWMAAESDKWFKFDDEDVSSYYFKDLPGEAFGGDQASLKESEVEKFLANTEKAYGKSAYMLVYECQRKKPIR